jgi:Nucleotidyl transferase AbiEii toxin, Type IV TA system
MSPRQPDANDLVLLIHALTTFGVEYALIGGTAMAVHGFSRATKDIDLLLPVDADNNARLLQALASIPGNKQAMAALRREWMDKGHSTALEGEIFVDLLYVAASKSFESLKSYVQTVMFNGVPVVTLDVDGMLLTKKTSRESDIPDRLKLERLRNALRSQKNT